MAWQLIAKAIGGAVGGGLKAAGESGKTNLSGTQQTGTQSEEQTAGDIGSGIGSIAGSLMKKGGK